jgi:hypothetical protein
MGFTSSLIVVVKPSMPAKLASRAYGRRWRARSTEIEATSRKIKRVRHPKRNQAYKTTDEKSRQIVERAVPLHELASYFSAYRVVDGMINEVEAMLVRSFANDLLNTLMERFSKKISKQTLGFALRIRATSPSF